MRIVELSFETESNPGTLNHKTHLGEFNTGDFYEIKDYEIKDKIL